MLTSFSTAIQTMLDTTAIVISHVGFVPEAASERLHGLQRHLLVHAVRHAGPPEQVDDRTPSSTRAPAATSHTKVLAPPMAPSNHPVRSSSASTHRGYRKQSDASSATDASWRYPIWGSRRQPERAEAGKRNSISTSSRPWPTRPRRHTCAPGSRTWDRYAPAMMRERSSTAQQSAPSSPAGRASGRAFSSTTAGGCGVGDESPSRVARSARHETVSTRSRSTGWQRSPGQEHCAPGTSRASAEHPTPETTSRLKNCNRPDGRRGNVQPRDRAGTLHLSSYGCLPPLPHLPKARDHVTQPAAPRHLRPTDTSVVTDP